MNSNLQMWLVILLTFCEAFIIGISIWIAVWMVRIMFFDAGVDKSSSLAFMLGTLLYFNQGYIFKSVRFVVNRQKRTLKE